MDLHGLQTQHNNLIQSMFYEGMLDSQFAQIQVLQDANNPNFVMEVITIFCNDAERIMLELNNYLGQQDVDFNKLNGLVHQLKGSSSSVGAQHLKLACIDLHQASEDKNKGRLPCLALELKLDNIIPEGNSLAVVLAIQFSHLTEDWRISPLISDILGSLAISFTVG
ncbi:hypothetical protein FH972_016574 [Carpinus fangiana]|uniref:Histidine-containing phosphotransfer protein n=1 Tax=Carpinus fangiana TaxID=176857 RepID=A0A5N6RJ89_9ROSI|nr:hypothetical protein FH972_016574 [Carpinus fangiana]